MIFLFRPIGLYIFAVVFIIYSFVLWFLPPLTKTKKRRIRTCFFSLWTLVFAVYYNTCKVSKLNYSTNNLGIPQNQWIFIINVAAFSVIGLLIDALIIFSRGIKSFGKDGIGLTDEEDEVVIKDQNNLIELYEKIIAAEYETIRIIPQYFENIKGELINNVLSDTEKDTFVDTTHELVKITETYFKKKNSKIQIGILEQKYINKIKSDYGLNFVEFSLLKSKLKEKSGYINNFKKNKILVFPYFSLTTVSNDTSNSNENIDTQKPLIIILYSETEDLLIKEQYTIINILRVFETNLQKTVSEIINELNLEEVE